MSRIINLVKEVGVSYSVVFYLFDKCKLSLLFVEDYVSRILMLINYILRWSHSSHSTLTCRLPVLTLHCLGDIASPIKQWSEVQSF